MANNAYVHSSKFDKWENIYFDSFHISIKKTVHSQWNSASKVIMVKILKHIFKWLPERVSQFISGSKHYIYCNLGQKVITFICSSFFAMTTYLQRLSSITFSFSLQSLIEVYDSHAIQFINLTCIIQWFLVSS